MTFEAIVFDETDGCVDRITVEASCFDEAIGKLEGTEGHGYEVLEIALEGRLD